MAGFNYSLGRSNNMVSAESRGMITIGRWAKKIKVSAAAARYVMQPREAHHTGTGHTGKSRLTSVIDEATNPTDEQLREMRAFDASASVEKSAAPLQLESCVARYVEWPGRAAKRRFPTEMIARLDQLLIYADGRIMAKRSDRDGLTTSWEKKSGLVIAQNGRVCITKNLNDRFDDAIAIAQRICK